MKGTLDTTCRDYFVRRLFHCDDDGIASQIRRGINMIENISFYEIIDYILKIGI